MATNNVLGLIFSNAYDEVIPELTALRTMGSVPFAGRYRLIDFQLSAMVNAGITKVGVITNNNYRSLMDHIGNGNPWDLSRKREGLTLLPPFSNPESVSGSGKANALYGAIGYIADSKKEYVLLTDCNIIANIDYEDLYKYTVRKNADVTIAYAETAPSTIARASEFDIDDEGRITASRYVDDFTGRSYMSLKVMIIRRTLLERLLHEANAKRINDLELLIANNIDNIKAYAYRFDGYSKVIDSLSSYYEANLDLLKPEVRSEIFTADAPVYTKVGDRTPAKYGIVANVKNSLIADGTVIEGEVENCIIFRGVRIGKGAKVKNSIIMQDTVIGDNAEIECVIADKDITIGIRKKLCGAENYPIYIGKGITI